MSLSLQQFIDQIVASTLLSAQDIQTYVDGLPVAQRPQDAEQLARSLVHTKKLTAFQAQQCFSGKGKSLVLGNYILLDKLGQGGMGMVLKAQHKRMKRIVALKVLAPNVSKDAALVARFHREVEAAARLSHANIVAAFDADEANNTSFLVMEYVEGTDLSSLVKKKGPLPIEQAIQCTLQAAKGLEYAHKQGVIHRDIKPANLLLDREGVVKILDMGLARIEGEVAGKAELTSTGAVMGTVDYMAPEQALSTKHADARSDIYSLGIALWYLCKACPAYDGDSLMARLLAHREAPIPSLVPSDAPANSAIVKWMALDAVFRKMVAKKSADRYQAMTEVVAALEACQRGEAVAPSVTVGPGEDSRLDQFLAKLDTSPTRGDGTLAVAAVVSPTAVTRPLPMTGQYEATLTTSDGEVPTDPQTLTSLPQKGRKSEKHVAAEQAGRRPLWRDRRAQILAGLIAAIIVAALWPRGPHSTDSPKSIEATNSSIASVVPSTSPAQMATQPVTAVSPSAAAGFALEFDGKAAVDLSGLLTNDPAIWTIEAWVRFDAPSPDGVIYAPTSQTGLRMENAQGNRLRMSMLRDPSGHLALEAKSAVDQGRWMHVAGVFEPTRIALFVDGVQIATQRRSADRVQPCTTPPQIGFKFVGAIDEVRVSNTARYSTAFDPPTRHDPDEHTLALYHFDEGTGSRVQDATRFARHGRLQGAKWIPARAAASTPPPSSPSLAAQDWDVLYDTVTGYHGWETLGPFEIQDGLLVANGGGANAVSRDDYSDFELEAEWKVGPSGNSGIYYREAPTQKIGAGNEYQILDDAAYAAKQPPNMQTGSLYGLLPPATAASKPIGEWNLTRIVCRGTQVEHWLNGQRVVQYDTASDAWQQGLTASTFGGKDSIGLRPTGRILLQGHTGEVAFRSIRIRALAATAGNSRLTPDASLRGLSFDGIDDGVEIPTLHFEEGQPLTLECWVQPRKFAGNGLLIVMRGNPSAGLSVGEKTWNANVFQAGVPHGTHASVEGTRDRLVHVASVWDGQELRLYIDGRRSGDAYATTARGAVPQGYTQLGGGPPPGVVATGPWFDGTLHEVRISKSPRYLDDFTPDRQFTADDQTLALYRFDEGEGDVLHDAGGHGHDGRIVGATWVVSPPLASAAPATGGLEFDGIDDVVQIPSLKIPPSPFTLEAEVSFHDPASLPDAAEKHEDGQTILGWDFGARLMSMWMEPLDRRRVWGQVWPLDGGRAAGQFFDVSLTPQRHHVALVMHADFVEMYVDGELQGLGTNRFEREMPSAQVDALFAIGGAGQSTNPPQFFHGRVHAVRVSSRDRYHGQFQPETLTADADTLALYKFDEAQGAVLHDSSGHGHDGKIVGATWVGASTASGQRPVGSAASSGHALQFDGVDDYVALPDDWQYDGGDFTFEAWVVPEDVPVETSQMLFVLDHGAASGDSRHAVRMLRERSVSVGTGAVRRRIQLAVPGTASVQQFEDTLTTGRLTHVAAIWRGGVGQLFIDGQPQTPTTGIWTFAERQTPPFLWLGAIHSPTRGPIDCWQGHLQQVRLRSGAHYDAAFTPPSDLTPTAETVALYRFTDGDGDVLTDSSGQNRHAKIVGPQWVRLPEAAATSTAPQ